MTTVIEARQLKVGDQVAEADGFLWDVAAVEWSVTGRRVTLTLCSDFSSFKSHWRGAGVKKTLRASTRVWAVRS